MGASRRRVTSGRGLHPRPWWFGTSMATASWIWRWPITATSRCCSTTRVGSAAVGAAQLLGGQVEEEDFSVVLRADRQLIHVFDPHAVARLERRAVHLRRAAGQVQPPQSTLLEMV